MFGMSFDDDGDAVTFGNELTNGLENQNGGDDGSDHLHSPSPLLDTAILPNETDNLCPYCNKSFRKPRVLDCLHSMCEDCIIAQLDGRRDFSSVGRNNMAPAVSAAQDFVLEGAAAERPTPPGVIRCPICKQESHVGNDMRFVNLMLHDFVRMNDLEAETMMTGQRPCKACKSEEPAVAMCQQCPADLCSNCVNAHKFMRCFDGHVVVTYDELMASVNASNGTNNDGSPMQNKRVTLHQTVICPPHGLPYAILCLPCECLICPHCQPEHANHDLKNVTDEVAELVQQQLLGEAEMAERKAKSASAALSFIPHRLGDLVGLHESAASAIEEAFEGYRRCLDEAKAAMLLELDQKRDEQEKQLHTMCENVDRTVGKISDAVSFTQRLVANADKMELVASRKKVYDQLKALQYAMPSCHVAVELLYRPAESATFTRQLAQIAGKIQCGVIATAAKDESALLIRRSQPQPQPLRSATAFSGSAISGVGAVAAPASAGPPAYSGSNSRGSSSSTNPSPPFTNLRGNNPQPILGTGIASSAGPGTIGMERRQHRNSQQQGAQPQMTAIGTRMNSLDTASASGLTITPQTPNDFHSVSNNGWPPSSNPPPLDEQQLAALATRKPNTSGSGQSTLAYMWPPSSNPLIEQQLAAAMASMSTPQTPIGGPPSLIGVPPLAPPGLPPLLKPLPTGLWGAPPAAASSMAGLTGQMLAANYFSSTPRSGSILGPPMPPMDPIMHPADPMMAAAFAGMALDSANIRARSQCPTPSDNLAGVIGERPTTRLTRNGEMTEMRTFCLIGGGPPASGPCQFNMPHGFCLGMQDEIVVADTQNHRIQIVSARTSTLMAVWGRQGKTDGELFYPRKVTMMTRGGVPIYIVCDRGPERSRMQLFTRNGDFLRKYTIDYCDIVAGLCFDAINEEIVLVDSVSPTIFRLRCETGEMIGYVDCQNHMQEPSDIAIFQGDYYVCDFKGNAICVFSRAGQLLRRIGTPDTTPFPSGIDISVAGDVLVGDSHGNRYHVAAFTTGGKLQQEFELLQPKVSRCSGLRITPEGHVVTLARNNNQVLVMNTLFLR